MKEPFFPLNPIKFVDAFILSESEALHYIESIECI